MSASKDDYEAGLDPKAREVLQLLRANPGKDFTVMDIYGSIYSDEEKSQHTKGDGGLQEMFKRIQGWLNEFCEQGYVKSKRVATSFFYTVSE
jgi:hypothetical protein